MQNKILIATPTSAHKDYCVKEWAKHLLSKFSMHDILIVDNSKESKHYKELQKLFGEKAKVIQLNPKTNDIRKRVELSNEYIHKYCLRNDYTHLFFLESDIFLQENSIDYLLYLNKDFVSLPYFIKSHFKSRLINYKILDAGYSRSMNLKTLEQSFIEFDGNVKVAFNTGIGAALIKANVLEHASFKIDDNSIGYPDSYFHNSLMQMGIDAYQVQKYIAKHNNSNWQNIKSNE